MILCFFPQDGYYRPYPKNGTVMFSLFTPGGALVRSSRWGGGYPGQVQMEGYPSQVRMGEGYPGQGWGTPIQRWGTLLSRGRVPPRDRTADGVLDMWWRVCLLHSCRRRGLSCYNIRFLVTLTVKNGDKTHHWYIIIRVTWVFNFYHDNKIESNFWHCHQSMRVNCTEWSEGRETALLHSFGKHMHSPFI